MLRLNRRTVAGERGDQGPQPTTVEPARRSLRQVESKRYGANPPESVNALLEMELHCFLYPRLRGFRDAATPDNGFADFPPPAAG